MNRTISTVLAAAGLGLGAYAATRGIVRRRRRIDLVDKVAIVTGGSRGLGLAIARELASRGARVAICARDEGELRSAQDDLRGRGARAVFAATCDVSDNQQVGQFVEQVRGHFDRDIDILVNNAGIIQVGPAAHMRLHDYQEIMRTNFQGALHFILQVMPDMRRRRSGRIVNIASFGAKIPPPHLAPYAASKYALLGLSETLRAELLADGVYVTTVCPGLIRTGSPGKALFKGQREKEFAWFATGDHLPVFSIAPQRLARQIVDAMQHGQAELISPFPARWQAKLFALMPSLSSDVIAWINRLLPAPAANGGDLERTGRESDSGRLDRFTRARFESAKARYNQT